MKDARGKWKRVGILAPNQLWSDAKAVPAASRKIMMQKYGIPTDKYILPNLRAGVSFPV